jgi:thiamine biosynthesis lipoprotein
MGTVFTVRVDDDVDPAAVDGVFEWWADVEARFSTFIPDSQISRIGRGELAPDDADPDVRHVLSVCAEFEETTGGRFSIRPGRPGGPGLDPAGYVKGWSVDEAALLLRGAGARNFVIYAGGDVLCSGVPSDDTAWRVGIRDPAHPERLIAAIRMERGAVATSGSYARGDHIWGPHPGAAVASVSVIGPVLGVADALATALYAAGESTFGWIGAFPEYGVLMVARNGAMTCSTGLVDRLDGVERQT